MNRTRTAITMTLVFLVTMGAYFYVKFMDAHRRKTDQEYGNPSTSGFREFFLADAALTDPQEKADQANAPQAVAVAERMRKAALQAVAEHVELPAVNDPLKITRPRVYCLRRGKYCMFLVYVPNLAALPEDEQQELALALWDTAQTLAAAEIQGHPTVGLGLRGHRLFGPILIGGKKGTPLLTQSGGRYVFYPYFEGEPSLQVPPPAEAGKGNSVARRSGPK